jgi:hypothetical protein
MKGSLALLTRLLATRPSQRHAFSAERVVATIAVANGQVPTNPAFELPRERMIVEIAKLVFEDVPVYDAPTLITDKSLLMP